MTRRPWRRMNFQYFFRISMKYVSKKLLPHSIRTATGSDGSLMKTVLCRRCAAT